MASDKSWTAKFYAQDGITFRKNISTGKPETEGLPYLKTNPSFPSRLNGGLGELVLDVAYPFDAVDLTVIDWMNIVDIWCYDEDNPRGRRIYRGFISRYEPYVEGGNQGVRVTVLGLVSITSFSYYKNGTSYTVTHTTQDPETIGRAIIDHVNSIYGGSLLSYSAASTDPTGTNVSIEFVDQKWFDALKKTKDVCSTGWWWKIDENGVYWLKPRPSSVTHTFTIGKDVDRLSLPKDSEKVVNDVQVRYSSGSYDFDDATSQVDFGTGSPATGKRSEIISATDLTDLTAAQQRGQKRVNDQKDERIKGTLIINSQYDLESIKVGETCNIRNFSKNTTFFEDGLMIAGVTYNGFTCSVELEEQSTDLGLALAEFVG